MDKFMDFKSNNEHEFGRFRESVVDSVVSGIRARSDDIREQVHGVEDSLIKHKIEGVSPYEVKRALSEFFTGKLSLEELEKIEFTINNSVITAKDIARKLSEIYEIPFK